MAQVMFKRGAESALPKTGLIEGAFYLTTDTDKLYVCNDGQKLSLLNQVVHNVANIGALPTIGNAAVGEFYYCLQENVLATKKTAADESWTQINTNTDTVTSSITDTTSVGSNTATVTTTIKRTDKNGKSIDGDLTTSFRIKGAGDNTITREENGTIVITGKNDNATYTLGTATNESQGEIKLTGSGTDATTTSIAVKGANGIAVKSDADGNLTVDGTELEAAIATAKESATINAVANTFAADGSFTTQVSTSNGGTISSAPITPKIQLGDNTTEYKFASGIATLPVYTKTEVDDKIDTYFKAADAMVYKGLVYADGDLPTANVECGWTFKVAAGGQKYAGKDCKLGDLIIAKADAVTATNDTWEVVHSGDDQVIKGDATASGITVSDDATILAGITMADGDCTTVAGTVSGKVTTIKVNHNKATGTLTTGSTADVTQTAKGSADFSAITGITRDAYGHVTGTTVKKLHVVDTDTHNDVTAVSVGTTHTDNAATVNFKVATSDTSAGKSANLTVTSDNLTITNGTEAGTTAATSLKINLEWGDF